MRKKGLRSDVGLQRPPHARVEAHQEPNQGCVTKRRNRGSRCNSASKTRKTQKAHSKTDSRPNQQHKNGSSQIWPQTASDDEKHPTRTGAAETKRRFTPSQARFMITCFCFCSPLAALPPRLFATHNFESQHICQGGESMSCSTAQCDSPWYNAYKETQ